MRLAELSRRSGVSVPTIKYYLREGLLPAGRTTSPRQAEYDEEHLRRLRMVRALVDVGGLSVAAARDVLAAMTGPFPVDAAVGAAHAALPPQPDGSQAGSAEAAAVVGRLGWVVDEASSAFAQLGAALAALDAVGLTLDDDRLATYGSAAMSVAELEVRLARETPEADRVTLVVLGTVLLEPVLLALRRLAQSDAYRRSR